jgi:hypothetical protein
MPTIPLLAAFVVFLLHLPPATGAAIALHFDSHAVTVALYFAQAVDVEQPVAVVAGGDDEREKSFAVV